MMEPAYVRMGEDGLHGRNRFVLHLGFIQETLLLGQGLANGGIRDFLLDRSVRVANVCFRPPSRAFSNCSNLVPMMIGSQQADGILRP